MSSGAILTGDAVGPVIATLLASVGGSALAWDLYQQERRAGTPLPRMRDLWRAHDAPLGRALGEGAKVGLVRNVDALGVQILPTLILGKFGDERWVSYLRIAQRMVAMARRVELLLVAGQSVHRIHINPIRLPCFARRLGELL